MGDGAREQILVHTGKFGGQAFPETNATLALILSISGLMICGPLTAIPALIIAQRALAVTSGSPGHPDHDPAVASKWISIFTLVLWAIIILLAVAFYRLLTDVLFSGVGF